MGRGVVSLGGPEPVVRFSLVIERATVGQPRLQAVATDLFAGRRVTSTDDEVSVTFAGSASIGAITVRATAASAGFKLVATVRPLSLEEIASIDNADRRGRPQPIPDAWRDELSETAQEWELHNCNVYNIKVQRA